MWSFFCKTYENLQNTPICFTQVGFLFIIKTENNFVEADMFEKVKGLLAKQLNIKGDKIAPNSKILEDLGADSLDVVELLMTLEDEFGITVTDEEAVTLKTVNDIVVLIEKKTKK